MWFYVCCLLAWIPFLLCRHKIILTNQLCLFIPAGQLANVLYNCFSLLSTEARASRHFSNRQTERSEACCVVLCCVVLCCVVLCCVVLCCAALRCVALRCVALRCVALCCGLVWFCFICLFGLVRFWSVFILIVFFSFVVHFFKSVVSMTAFAEVTTNSPFSFSLPFTRSKHASLCIDFSQTDQCLQDLAPRMETIKIIKRSRL